MTAEFEVLPEEVPAESGTTDSVEEKVVKPVYEGPSPGELLIAAREERGLTLDDIVMQSRMSMETVKALEEDRDPPQNAWVYVRGYYRKYARVLGIPEEELLQAHELYVGGAPAPEPVSAEWAPQDVSPGGGVPKIVLVLIAGIIFGGLLWWLTPKFMGGADKDKEQMQETASEVTESTNNGTGSSITVRQTVAPPPVEIEKSSDDVAAEAAPSELPELSTDDGNTVDVDSDSDSESAVAADSDAQAPQTVHEDVAATPGPRLALDFTDRSWVNVVDANGKKLLDGIVKAGVQLAVSGQPPYKVFLGYAPGVELSYEGKMIDTSSYISSNNTARFTVGEDERPTP